MIPTLPKPQPLEAMGMLASGVPPVLGSSPSTMEAQLTQRSVPSKASPSPSPESQVWVMLRMGAPVVGSRKSIAAVETSRTASSSPTMASPTGLVTPPQVESGFPPRSVIWT